MEEVPDWLRTPAPYRLSEAEAAPAEAESTAEAEVPFSANEGTVIKSTAARAEENRNIDEICRMRLAPSRLALLRFFIVMDHLAG